MKIENKETLEQLGMMAKAFVARKTALTTFVDLAGMEAPVSIATREGDCYDITEPDNYYCAIGNNGDVWPVEKGFFDQNYEANGVDYKAAWQELMWSLLHMQDDQDIHQLSPRGVVNLMKAIANG